MPVAFRIVDLAFGEVGYINGLFQGQQIAGADEGHVLVAAVKGAGQLALVQVLQQGGEDLGLVEEPLVAALGRLLALVDAPLHHLNVRHHQLQIDDVNVPQGIGGALHVGDVGILKAANHMDNGISGTDVAQEFVAQTLALGGPLHQSGNVYKLNDRRGDLLGIVKLGQPVQPLIRHGHHTHIGVNGAERVVVRGNPRIGNGVEQGGLSHIG